MTCSVKKNNYFLILHREVKGNFPLSKVVEHKFIVFWNENARFILPETSQS